jgi:hypothetical protein
VGSFDEISRWLPFWFFHDCWESLWKWGHHGRWQINPWVIHNHGKIQWNYYWYVWNDLSNVFYQYVDWLFKGLNLNRWMDVFYFFAKLLSRRVVFVNDPWIVRGCSQKEDKRVPWPYGFGNCWGRIWWCHHHILIPDSDIQIYLSLNWLNYLIKIKFHFWEIDENNQPWPS